MEIDPSQFRALLNEQLTLLTDPRFSSEALFQKNSPMAAPVMERMTRFHEEKSSFVALYNYEWTLSPESYNTPFEALLQWRLLNTLSDIRSDHPSVANFSNIVVRVLPSSCARPHVRQVAGYRVIILTTGYLSAFKGFIRLFLRGCAMGQRISGLEPSNYLDYASNYITAVRGESDAVISSAQAYIGTLVQLIQNQVPIMDSASIFDDEVLKRDEWEQAFGIYGTAIDGFLLFHEAAHLLAGDVLGESRSTDVEMTADRGSISLCIIDEARRGGFGTVHLGGPLFFCVELLRLLCEEILAIRDGSHDPAAGRYPGIDELMLRSQLNGLNVYRYLGPRFHNAYTEWSNALTLAFDTMRWTLLNIVGRREALPPLAEFVVGE